MKPLLSSPYSRYQKWVSVFFLLMVTLAAYQPAWNGGLIFDDTGNITGPKLASIEGLGRIWAAPGTTMQYYPLLYTVFWACYHVFGASTTGYHLLTIVLHAFAAFLLAMVLLRLGLKRGAWLAAGIFALHPIMVESVAWITQLKNTLSGVFFLGAALAFVNFSESRQRRPYFLALGLFILGLLSKTAIAAFPLAVLAVLWWKRGRLTWRREILPLLPFFLAALLSGIVTIYVEHSFIGLRNIGDELGLSFLERVLLAGRIFWFYLGKVFFPADLLFFYPRWDISAVVWWQYLFPATALLVGGALWAARKRWRAPFAAFLFFSAMLLPVIGFLNVYFFRYSFVADHLQYYAAIGPIALAAGLAEKGLEYLAQGMQRFFRPAAFGIIFLTLGGLTWKQSALYDNAELLYRTTIKKNPACWIAYNNLGVILSNTRRMDEAMATLLKALKIKNDFAEVYFNCGTLLMKIGRIDEAIANYRKALEIDPNYVEARKNLGEASDIAVTIKLAAALQQNPDTKNAIALLEKAFAEAVSAERRELAVQIRAALEQFYRSCTSESGKSKE
jgi:tetratricopeptide (TPR) repeat protein